MPGKSLTAQQNERVRAGVRELLKMRGDNQTAVAPLIGVEQATLSRFLSGVHGTSSHVALRVAQLLGRDPLEFLDPSRRPAVAPKITPVDPRYPSRAKAEMAARVLDCSDEDIQSAIDAHDSSDDPGDVYWVTEFLRARDKRRRREVAPPKSSAVPLLPAKRSLG